MLNFKEYTLTSFKNLFQERFKNHFLKKAGKDIFKFQYDAGFLGLLSENGDNSKAVEYFVNLIDNDNLYTNLFNSFLSQPDTPQKTKNYYLFAAHYMKKNNYPKGLSDIDDTLTKQQNAIIGLKEVFANELYEHLVILNKGDKSEGKISLDDIKKTITKTFVIDSRVKQEITRFNLAYYFYAYFNNSQTKNFGDVATVDPIPANRDVLFNGINLDTVNAAPLFTLDRKSLLYNNVALKFQNRIFNKQQYLENKKNAAAGSLKVVEENNTAYLSTTQQAKYTDLLEKNGAYIEFYFRYNNIFDKKETNVIGFDTGQPISIPYSNEDKNNLPQDVNYYSFREMLSYCLYLKSALIPALDKNGNVVQAPFTSPAFLSPNLNISFGARLVVNSPNLEQLIQGEIAPKGSEIYSTYNKLSPGQGEVNMAAVTPKELDPNPFDLVEAAKSYAAKNNINSTSKNKTFVSNFLDQTTGNKKQLLFNVMGANMNPFFKGLKTWYEKFYSVSNLNSVVLGEFEIKLSKAQVENFLQIIKGPVNINEFEYVDYIIDEEIIQKYYDDVIDGLVGQGVVNKYLTSELNSLSSVGSFYTGNDDAYKITTKGTILEGENDALKEEAGKMDDIIDQNLITLIDSVEAF